MKKVFKVFLIVIGVLVVIGIIGSIFDNKKSGSNSVDMKDSSSVSTTKWVYSEQVDKMTDKKEFIAEIEANDEMDFQPPYGGGVVVTLKLRKNSDDNDVILQISKGQFMPNIMDERSISVRFDNNQAKKFNYSNASDGSTETIFISNEKKFIESLKKCKHLIVQSEFFNEGVRTIEFDTDGLIWNH